MPAIGKTLVRLLPVVPKPVVRAISARYIAGPTLADAVQTVSELNVGGSLATVDVLGEEVTRESEARTVARTYHDLLAAIERDKLRANVSVKLTALGLGLSYELCRENLQAIVRAAAGQGNFVRIDMEDSSTTEDTLRLYRELREAGHDNLGVVLQARLHRTLQDVSALADLRPNVRLCKGIYLESPRIAYGRPQEIRQSFVDSLAALLDRGFYVGIATHDEWLITESLRLLSERGVGQNEYELQMLLGVREERARGLIADGHRLRIYVPFGERWYEYSVRRLQENPAIASSVARATAAHALRLRSATHASGARRG
jgi:proline dehydrogenase